MYIPVYVLRVIHHFANTSKSFPFTSVFKYEKKKYEKNTKRQVFCAKFISDKSWTSRGNCSTGRETFARPIVWPWIVDPRAAWNRAFTHNARRPTLLVRRSRFFYLYLLVDRVVKRFTPRPSLFQKYLPSQILITTSEHQEQERE